MKKFEMYVENILMVAFFYLLSIIMIMFNGFFQNNYIFIFLRHINSFFVFIGIIISLLAVVFFPLWNIYKEYEGMKLGKIIKLESRYKRNYKRLFIGFLCLGILSKSGVVFDLYFSLGIISIFLYLAYLRFWKKIKKIKIIKSLLTEVKAENKIIKKENWYLRLVAKD
jgi:hypothetical protein